MEEKVAENALATVRRMDGDEPLRTQVIARIARELPGPLTPLKAYLTMMLRGKIDDRPEARREYYRAMLAHAERLEKLIRDLLELAGAESGKPFVAERSVDLAALLVEQTREFSRRHQGRDIECRAPDEPIQVVADPSAVRLILETLLSNAVKYSPAHAPVQVWISPLGEDAVVSVRDEGEGISSSKQRLLLAAAAEPVLENGGPGLSLAKRLTEAMGGRFLVESTPGEGSTFSFSLPLAAPRA